MIAHLRGQLAHRGAESVVVDVGGVGYRVYVSRQTLERLPAEGQPVELAIHTQLRQDAVALFGFAGRAEQEVFEALITVSGVGPKAAMGILSGIEAGELARAVCSGDLARLCLVPGVGKKTAERLRLDLKDRLLPLVRVADGQDTGADGRLGELRSALANLGYKPAEAERALAALRERALGGENLDALLLEALRLLRG